jgi:hypothetical protein
MKTRILFFLLLSLAFGWVGYALWLTKTHQTILSPETYFTADSEIQVINRPDFCLDIPENWAVNGLSLKNYLNQEETFTLWKTIALQVDSQSGKLKLLFEEKPGLTDTQLIDFLKQAGLQLPDKKESQQGEWYIIRSHGFLALSQDPIHLKPASESPLGKQLGKRDIYSSYSVLTRTKREEVYCFPTHTRTYITTQEDFESFGESHVSDDGELYVIVPESYPDFLFVERQSLHILSDEWKNFPLTKYIDRGILLAGNTEESVVFIDLSGQYTPKEVLEEWAIDSNARQNNIYQLKISVNGMNKPYATGLENGLVVSSKKEVLERIRLSYQMGKGWSSTSQFSMMRRDTPHRVTMRWSGLSQIPEGLKKLLPMTVHNGNLVVRKSQKELVWSLYASSDSNENTDIAPKTDQTGIEWNFSLENKNSRFFLGEQTICVYNPDKGTISQVNVSGKVAQWIKVDEPIKTIHSLEGGFLIESFQKLIWFPEQPSDDKVKEIPFKGAISSNIARYIWTGHPSVGFISENVLYRISLKSGDIQRDRINQQIQLKDVQLHAFNYEGNLTFGLFHERNFHLFNTKKSTWKTINLDGNVLWSKKIDAKIHYLTKDGEMYNYHVFQERKRSFSEQMNYMGYTLSASIPVFIFSKEGALKLVPDGIPSSQVHQLTARNPESILVVLNGLKAKYIIALNGISNEIEWLEPENNVKIVKNGSQFLKFVSPNKVITYVDGQLVMYKF